MFPFGISKNGDDMLKEASGKAPGTRQESRNFWKTD
jgi:hypothetical protein